MLVNARQVPTVSSMKHNFQQVSVIECDFSEGIFNDCCERMGTMPLIRTHLPSAIPVLIDLKPVLLNFVTSDVLKVCECAAKNLHHFETK
jgi:hypothetical protein